MEAAAFTEEQTDYTGPPSGGTASPTVSFLSEEQTDFIPMLLDLDTEPRGAPPAPPTPLDSPDQTVPIGTQIDSYGKDPIHTDPSLSCKKPPPILPGHTSQTPGPSQICVLLPSILT